MTSSQKENLLRALERNEECIKETQSVITEFTATPYKYGVTEPIAAYASRLNGYILERRGICFAIITLGYKVVWNGNHATDIVHGTAE